MTLYDVIKITSRHFQFNKGAKRLFFTSPGP